MFELILASMPYWVKTTIEIGYNICAVVFLIFGVLMLYNIYREPLDDEDDYEEE